MTVHLRSSFGPVMVVPAWRVGQMRGEPIDSGLLQLELAGWLSDPRSVSALLRILAEGNFHRGGQQHDARDVQDAFRRGELRALRVPFQVAVVERTVKAEPLGPEPVKPTFVEILLLDPEGEPVANERYRITFESREVREGKLDRNGFVRIEQVHGGEVTVEFPDRAAA